MRSPLKSLATLSTMLALGLLSTTAALASPDCTKEPQSKWLSEAAMKERVAKLGYKVNVFKISGNCYEIYGWTKDGAKAEVYFNPVTGEVVKSYVDEK